MFDSRNRQLRGALFTLFLSFVPASIPAQQLDPSVFEALVPRAVGPVGASGRVTAIVGVPGDPERLYVGAASGGLWTTANGGTTWQPLFDEQPVQAIGAVAVFAGDPKILWVGTGEANLRASAVAGDGVYRSDDAGASWRHLGLDETRHIAAVVLHPKDSAIAWVAAMGDPWRPGPARGVFRTEDGGKSWQRVLFVDDQTGAADLRIDPSDPNRLLAAMWQMRRHPWVLESGGPSSGIFQSLDGGRTWRRESAKDGLPEGDLGRIKLAFAPSAPKIVYAFVEARPSALLRSEDGGGSWTTVDRGENLFLRPFYFASFEVDPKDPRRLYNLDFTANVSSDGGASFEEMFPGQRLHPDFHAIWIDPDDPRRLTVGNDGGVAISRDGGETAFAVTNLPIGQVYRVAVDAAVPSRVYAGLLDNGSWRGATSGWSEQGSLDRHWQRVGGGDGIVAAPSSLDPFRVFALSQNGGLVEWDERTGEERDLTPYLPDGRELRFGWTAGFAADPFTPGTIYLGSQYFLRSRDGGESWEALGPDLSAGDPHREESRRSGGLTPDVGGSEFWATITAIAPSSRVRGLIWVGTDDGRVHRSRDGGATWTSLEARIAGLPAGVRISEIHASAAVDGEVFVVVDARERGDREPYFFASRDFGESWQRLPAMGVVGAALALVQDALASDLVFAGTDRGLWISFDRGRTFQPWRWGLPAVPVGGLAITPDHQDLIVGTHGRGLFVIDGLAPLRSLGGIASSPLHLFEVADAVQHAARGVGTVQGSAPFRGADRPYGTFFDIWVGGVVTEGEQLEIEVADEWGQRQRTLKRAARPGLNRVSWGLKRDSFKLSPRWAGRPSPPGPELPPGRYQVTVRRGDQRTTRSFAIRPDPRSPRGVEGAAERWRLLLAGYAETDRALTLLERVRAARARVGEIAAGGGPHAVEARALEPELAVWEGRLWRLPGTPIGAPYDD